MTTTQRPVGRRPLPPSRPARPAPRIEEPLLTDVPVGFHLCGNQSGEEIFGPELKFEKGGKCLVGCTYCKRPVVAELLKQDDDNIHSHQRDHHQQNHAWVTVVYGSSPTYFLGALVLGHTLRKSGTNKDLVLLHTDDVSPLYVDALRRYWIPVRVDYISEKNGYRVSRSMFRDSINTRFKDVFTKLRVFELVQYDKVCLLDNDLLIRQNADDIFDLTPPAAMIRGKTSIMHGARVSSKYFWRGQKQNSGINAGVMLVSPDKLTFQVMIKEIGEQGSSCTFFL
jgi:hypothetical protein